MPRNSPRQQRANGQDRKRQLVAQETARIIVTQGIRDYRVAKRKAADRLGLTDRGSLPGNGEIEQAIEDYHQIFGGAEHPALLRRLRTAALTAMELLAPYSPRLVGPVLNGTADENSAVNLHVFSDSAEAVGAHLDAGGIAYRMYERRLKSRKDRVDGFAGYEFNCGGAIVQATVFPFDGIRQAPLSPVDGRPMQRADARTVGELLG
ncbi:MAG TPA: hypothetical protein VFY03_02740 [Woeseiaceae bacterium]|nr:hypothetical protein [Woeseiaceae bacterium]